METGTISISFLKLALTEIIKEEYHDATRQQLRKISSAPKIFKAVVQSAALPRHFK